MALRLTAHLTRLQLMHLAWQTYQVQPTASSQVCNDFHGVVILTAGIVGFHDMAGRRGCTALQVPSAVSWETAAGSFASLTAQVFHHVKGHSARCLST